MVVNTHQETDTQPNTSPIASSGIQFNIPAHLEASQPPEARGLRRDEVRLLVSYTANHHFQHTKFHQIKRFLSPGDLILLNTSATLKAALPIQHSGDEQLSVHLSTRLPKGSWVVELRKSMEKGTATYYGGYPNQQWHLPGGAVLRLLSPYQWQRWGKRRKPNTKIRLWLADLSLPIDWLSYLDRYGTPIRYGYVPETWPLDCYQTVYAYEPGSAEMPSAGRPFTPEILTELLVNGVRLAPLTLHTGVASLEEGEPPYAEYFRLPAETAELVNLTRQSGGRVIAVGTTVVRAVESAADQTGKVHPTEGWTELVITPQRGLHVVDGLLTGFHEPRASHLAMLAALCGKEHLVRTYQAALDNQYLWHEFGDLHLILPGYGSAAIQRASLPLTGSISKASTPKASLAGGYSS